MAKVSHSSPDLKYACGKIDVALGGHETPDRNYSEDKKSSPPSPVLDYLHERTDGALGDLKAQEQKCSDESPNENEARMLQIRLLALSRCMLGLTRICVGPLVVSMTVDFHFTVEQKGHILSAFATGYALTQVVGGLVADRIGGASLLLLGLLVSAFGLLALPSLAGPDISHLCCLLWLMGFTVGPTYPSIQAMTALWSTVSFRSYASALSAAGSSLGSLLALGLTPVLSARLGWRITSQIFGMILLAFSVIWKIYGRSSPTTETKAVHLEITWATTLSSVLAWVRILVNPAVLVIIVAHSIHNFVRYFLFAWMPTYYNEELKASADEAGFQMILPELASVMSGMLVAKLARNLQQQGSLSTLGCRRCFAAASFIGQGVGLLGISCTRNEYAATAFICWIQIFSSCQGPGFHANYLDVTHNSSGLLTGIGDSFATAASGCGSLLASWMLKGQVGSSRQDAWHGIFLVFAVSNVLGLLLFVPFSAASPIDVHEKHQDKN